MTAGVLRNHPVKLAIVVSVAAQTYCLPIYFEFGIQQCVDLMSVQPTQTHMVAIIVHAFRANPYYYMIYRTVLYAIFVTVDLEV